MELLGKLGIDWKLLIAQIVNFVILLFVLKKFLYKPVLNFLDQRSKKIAESLEKAKQIDEELKKTSFRQEAVLAEARKEASAILAKAKDSAEQVYKEKLAQTSAEAKQIVESARVSIAAEKEKLVESARAQIAGLVVDATSKVLEGAVTEEVDTRLVEKMLKNL